MKFIKARLQDAQQISDLVHNTILNVYPQYYPLGIVNSFCKLHSKENIAKDIAENNVFVLWVDGVLIGTGTYTDNHITRVFVDYNFQNKGYGSYIMQCLEDAVAVHHQTVYLDASLPASMLYEHRGYKTVNHQKWECENGAILIYEIMQKILT